MIRAVLDTNVVLAAQRASNPQSPNIEIFRRWAYGEFEALYSRDTLTEYAEKMLEHGMPEALVTAFIRAFQRAGHQVTIRFFHLRNYPNDPDDIAFVLCAVNGGASHLVTYDSDYESVIGRYDFHVCSPLEFLGEVRGH